VVVEKNMEIPNKVSYNFQKKIVEKVNSSVSNLPGREGPSIEIDHHSSLGPVEQYLMSTGDLLS
jgi:hypothetical protein